MLSILLLLGLSPLLAQDVPPDQTPAPPPETSKSEGFFIALGARSLAFQGDLDGRLVLWHFEKAFFSPRLDTAPGLGLGIGIKHAGWLWEAGYVESRLNAHLPDRMSRAIFRSIEISGKSFLLKEFPLQPYISLGISVPILNVGDGSELLGVRTSASYIGIGAEAGAGFVVDVGSSLFLSVGAGYRALGYYYASGEGKGRDITELHVGYEGPVWKNWLRSTTFEWTVGLGFVL
jgi:hypothetical protein